MGIIIGEYITRLTRVSQPSFPFPRGGQGVLLSVDVLDVPGGSVTLQVDVQHKNSEDGSWAALGSFSGITSNGVKTYEATGLFEQLRFVFSITGGVTPHVYDTFYINVLAPVWRP